MPSVQEKLSAFLQPYQAKGPRPILWVGAGASVAAGYPTLAQIEERLCQELPGCRDSGFALVDAYVTEFGKADLWNRLPDLVGQILPPVGLHHALARLLGAGIFKAAFTTNYDRLLEQALSAAQVRHLVQAMEANFVLSERRTWGTGGAWC